MFNKWLPVKCKKVASISLHEHNAHSENTSKYQQLEECIAIVFEHIAIVFEHVTIVFEHMFGHFLECFCNSPKPAADPDIKLTRYTALGVIERMTDLEIKSSRDRFGTMMSERWMRFVLEANNTSFYCLDKQQLQISARQSCRRLWHVTKLPPEWQVRTWWPATLPHSMRKSKEDN